MGMNTEKNSETVLPKTLVEAIRYFSDPKIALAFFVDFRWPHGVCCPRCGSTNVLFLANYARWKCREKHDSPQFTVKVGSIMEDSPMGLDKWAAGIWLEVNAKNSISSYEVARALGITQKSAWFMLHRCRHALHVGSFDTKLSGVVEVDETYVGGKAQNMHKAKRAKVITSPGVAGKTPVMGLLARHDGQRHSTVRAEVINDRYAATLHPIIHKNVEPGTQIYTDSLAGYRGLTPMFMHDFVDHANAYVKDKVVHTNGMENFWSLFKRCIKGTHISVEPFHLTAYVDSEAFRFNYRELNDGGRFALAVKGINGKRITYKTLIGKPESEDRKASDNGEASAGNLPN
jgi:transposase-like protein